MKCFGLGLIIFLALLCPDIQAQSPSTKIRELLQDETRDTVWIKSAINNGLQAFSGNGPYDSLFLVGEKIVEASNVIGFEWGLFYGNYLKGRAFFESDLDSAAYYFQQGISRISDTNYSLQSRAFGRLTMDYYNENRFDLSMPYARQMATTANKAGIKRRQATAHIRMGLMYSNQVDYVEAVSNFLKVIEIGTEIDNQNLVYSASLNLSAIYDDLKDYEKALEYALKSEKADRLHAQKNGGKYKLNHKVLNNIGRFETKLGNYQAGKEYLHRDVKLYKGLDDVPCQQMFTRYNLGNIHLIESNLDSALYYLDQAFELASECKNDYIRSLASFDLGQVHDQLNVPSKAEFYYQQAYESAVKGNKASNEFINATYQLYKINLAKGKAQKALQFLEDFGAAKDSLYNLETNKQMALLEMEFNFESEKQALLAASEREQLVLENELQRKTIFQYALVAVALFILLIALNFYRSNLRRKRANEIIQRQNADLSASASQIRQLSSFKEGMIGMIAHDMKNSLNTILGLSKRGEQVDDKKINSIQVAGGNILNLVSNMLDVQKFEEAKVNLNKERSLVSSIIDRTRESMEPLLQSKSMVMKHEVNGILSLSLDPEIINRVLVNLVSNSVKYAPTGSYVLFEVAHEQRENGDFAILSVTDQGTGIDEKFLPQLFEKFTQSEAKSLGNTGSSGLGLHFCKLAIEAHGGEIWAESPSEAGLKISFSIPVEETNLNQHGYASSRGQMEQTDETGAHDFNPQDLEQIGPFIEKLKGFKVYQIKQIREVVHEMEEAGLSSKWQDQVWKAALHGDADLYKSLLEEVC